MPGRDQYVNNRGKRLIKLCNSIDLHIRMADMEPIKVLLKQHIKIILTALFPISTAPSMLFSFSTRKRRRSVKQNSSYTI